MAEILDDWRNKITSTDSQGPTKCNALFIINEHLKHISKNEFCKVSALISGSGLSLGEMRVHCFQINEAELLCFLVCVLNKTC